MRIRALKTTSLEAACKVRRMKYQRSVQINEVLDIGDVTWRLLASEFEAAIKAGTIELVGDETPRTDRDAEKACEVRPRVARA